MALTQVGYGPLWRIDGPPPIQPPYGLIQAAASPAAGVRIVTDTDAQGVERWGAGVDVFPYPVDMGDVYDQCATGTDHIDKGFGAALPSAQFSAFTAFMPITCTSYRVWDQDEFKARAVAAFEAVESAIVAKEFMGGARMVLNPHLADGSGTFPNGNTVTSVKNGLALLTAEIAKSGRFGLIHCSPSVCEIARELFAVDDKTGVIRTINGIVVIPDFGYVGGATPASGVSGAHPAATGTQEWMYASGPVDVRRSEVFVAPETVAQALDRGTAGGASGGGGANSITYRAERLYVVAWDRAVQAAVLIDRCLTTCT